MCCQVEAVIASPGFVLGSVGIPRALVPAASLVMCAIEHADPCPFGTLVEITWHSRGEIDNASEAKRAIEVSQEAGGGR